MTNKKEQQLPTGWTEARLEELVTLLRGVSYKKQDATSKPASGRIPILRATNIDGELDFNDLVYVPSGNVSRVQLLNVGDIVIAASSGSRHVVGKAAALAMPWVGSFGAFCYALRPHEQKTANYLSLFLQSSRYRRHIFGLSAGVNINNLRREHIERVPIPVAPLNEQRRIASKIGELFSELDKGVESLMTARAQLQAYRQAVLKDAFEGKLTTQWREENKDRLETVKQLLARVERERESCYQQQLKDWNIAVKIWVEEDKPGRKPPKPRKPQIFEAIRSEEVDGLPNIPKTWCLVRLSQIAQVGTGMSVSAARTLEDPLEVPYLRVANVQRGFLDLSEIKSMTIERSQLDRLQLKDWDVLFNEGGDRDKLGRGWIWQSQIAPCITQNHVFRASLFIASENNSKLISYWANAFGRQYFEQQGKQTTNLASINKTVLSRFPVPLVPPEEQKKLCEQIEKSMTIVDSQEKKIESVLGITDLLRQSILNNAFSGELVEQDPNDEPATALLNRIKAEKASQNPGAKTRRRKVANA